MKTIATTLAAMFIISGLVLAGSDAGSMLNQVIWSTFGICVMIVGGFWMINIHRSGL